jgi:uncharacterized protein YceH (UPF0502 family)
MSERPVPRLTAVEARVLAVLVEKARTVPDIYPLTLNALVAGCNQKTSREPVMSLGDADVLTAIDRLKALTLVIETSGGRTMRYAENARRVLEVPSESVALLATLMLRGPQTAAELRANCERLHRFSDLSAIEAYLDELAERAAGPYVVRLARQPGSRESRWAHLLSGPPQDVDASSASDARAADGSEIRQPAPGVSQELAELRERVQRLESDLADLRRALAANPSDLR